MFSNAEIGGRIEQRRNELGMTMVELADRIGVNKSTIQRYEKGRVEKIKLPVIESIALALSVNPAWLTGNTDDPTPTVAQIPDINLDDFTYAAHKYTGDLRPEDKETLIKMMQTLAAANKEDDKHGETDRTV